jgi:hypothetical protein
LTYHATDHEQDQPDLDDAWAGLLAADSTTDAEVEPNDLPVDDWRALAGALGPDVVQPAVAPSGAVVPDSDLPVAPEPSAIPAAPPVTPVAWPAPLATSAAPLGWQHTAPESSSGQPAAWRPYGTVYQTPAGASTADANPPHPAMLSGIPGAAAGSAALGAGATASAHLPSGVRPCHNCSLPVSAQARFCRRCGQPQG